MRLKSAIEHDSGRDPPVAFEELFERYGDFVRVLMAQLVGPDAGDPDDLAQEVFLVVLRHFPGVKIDSPGSWLYQISLRVAGNARRVARLRRVLMFGARTELEHCDRRTPEVLAGAREESRRLFAALEKLSEKKRTVFVLFELQGLTGQQVADTVKIPLKTAHTRLYHARREFLAAYHRLVGETP